MTYADLRDLIIPLAIPERVARDRIPSVRRHVLSGLVDLQRFIPGLRERNVATFYGPDLFSCGMTIGDRPSGEIIEVWAERADIPSDGVGATQGCACVVPYDVFSVAFVKARSVEYVRNGGSSDPSDVPQMLPQDYGFFAVDDDSIYAYPAAMDPWRLKVRYAAVVQSYEDEDEVLDLTESQKDLLILWVRAKYSSDLRCWQDYRQIMQDYFMARRDEIVGKRHELNPEIRRRQPMNRPMLGGLLGPSCSYAY